MLASIITTALDNLWYEIWASETPDGTAYEAYRYDAELGNVLSVACEWKRSHAERMARYDMARLGIA